MFVNGFDRQKIAAASTEERVAVRRTKEEAQRTRESILDAAEQVFFEVGVARTTLERIAHVARVTRGAVYWHFQNKSDLFNAVVERVRMPMEDAFYRIVETTGTLNDLEELCIGSLVRLHEDRQLRRVFTVLLTKCEYTEDMDGLIERERAARRRAVDTLTKFFSRLQKSELVRTALPPRVLALALYSYMLGLYTDYLRSPEHYRLPDDATVLTRLFFAQLATASSSTPSIQRRPAESVY